MLERNCDVNKANHKGNFPLHLACMCYSLELVTLVSRNANSQIFFYKNKSGKTALHLSCQGSLFGIYFNSSYEILRFLVFEKNCKPALHTDPSIFADLNIEIACVKEYDFDLLEMLATKENVVSNGYKPPLKIACENNNIKAVKLITQTLGYTSGITMAELHNACTKSVELVELLVQNQDINAVQERTGSTLLHTACHHNQVDLIKLLVFKYQCDQSIQNKRKELPLHLACAQSLDAVKELKVDADGLAVVSYEGYTPLHIACKENKLDIVQYLVGIAKPAYLTDELHPLYFACECGSLEMVRCLIESGGNVFKKRSDGNTPLHIACQKGSLEIISYLVDNGHDTLIPNSRQELPLHIACTKSLDLVKITSYRCSVIEIESKASSGYTPLHIASSYGYIDIVKYLIQEKSCSPYTLDDFGNNALMFACGRRMYGYNKVSPDVAQYLVARGCNPQDEVETIDSEIFSPIYNSIVLGNLDLFKALVGEESYINSQNECGFTPLMLLCMGYSDQSEFSLQRLITEGKRKLFVNNDILLLPNSEKISSVIHMIMQSVKFLVERKCDQLLQNIDGNLALHIACQHQDLEVIKLLDSSCVNIKNINGDSPMHVAFKSYNFKILKYLVENSDCIDFSMLNAKSQTFLHLAVISENFEIVRLFVSKIEDAHFFSIDDNYSLCE